jgi:hypothetical protein
MQYGCRLRRGQGISATLAVTVSGAFSGARIILRQFTVAAWSHPVSGRRAGGMRA